MRLPTTKTPKNNMHLCVSGQNPDFMIFCHIHQITCYLMWKKQIFSNFEHRKYICLMSIIHIKFYVKLSP
eukprot:TRINITY_DN17167_c0_g1_i1.p1 TRINITY_DN17167_c0_g1~~TRINITY_DN17167_c0_g1_i1.p1  ORF type:complete len:70 (+),score=7.71 TRINITY_DN17167_c0_g1_i1:248-457(+)